MLIVGIYGKIVLYKYVSCWIVAEGSCIYGGLLKVFKLLNISIKYLIIGISYNGKNSNNEMLWNGCENIDIWLFERSYKFGHMVNSFNKCTNTWIAQ
jgi:lysophospholipid acyltransferase 5